MIVPIFFDILLMFNYKQYQRLNYDVSDRLLLHHHKARIHPNLTI